MSSSIAFRSVRAVGLPAARPCFARIARAPARAFRAGAVRAPDCACARVGQAQGARLPSVPLGFFRAGAKQEAKRPTDAASSCPILARIFPGQVLFKELFRKMWEQSPASSHGPGLPASHPGPPSQAKEGDSEGDRPNRRVTAYGSDGRQSMPPKETGRPGAASRESKAAAHSSSVRAARTGPPTGR